MTEYIHRPGYEELWGWFGLSRASWLTLPRILMHEMPDEWQRDMARLLNEYCDAFPNQPDLGTRVSALTPSGKLRAMPYWVGEYRHPQNAADEIKAMRGEPK